MTTPSADIVIGSDNPELHVSEMGWAKRISEVLEKHYPGYLWGVNVDLNGGMVTVQALSLSGQWGFYKRFREVANDPSLKGIKDAGGEILERYRVHRGKANADRIAELKRDFSGNFKVDNV